MTPSPPPRLPGLALIGVSALIFSLVLALGLTARVAPPPTVSELAPQAAQHITDVAQDLAGGSGGSGSGDGTGPGGGPSPSPPPTDPDSEIESERVRRCYGDPPRQIEDPQSPPCVPYWDGEGGNGGSTWKGVSDKEIRIAVGNYLRWRDEDAATGEGQEFDRLVERYETFFNRRFEFYGRKLNLITYTTSRPAVPAVNMQADAVKVDEEIGAFAATQYSEQDGRHYVYFDALADRDIVGVVTGSGGMSHTDEAHLARHAPYQWDYTPTADRMFRAYGAFICAALAGRPAKYAAPPQSERPERKFGIIVDTGYRDTPPFDIGPLQRALTGCDTELVVTHWGQDAPTTGLLLQLRDAGVTSVLYTGQVGLLALRIMSEASAQSYYPEWLVSELGFQNSDSGGVIYPKNHASRIFGLQAFNKTLRLDDMPYVWASREVAPDAPVPQGEHFERLYKSLLLLASGIQMAGPALTPSAFEEGLMRAEFPNPGAAGPPWYQARVGFPGVHSMQQDLAMVWLNASERSPQTGVAPAFCYVDRGTRYGLGDWPSDVEFFSGPCR